MRDLANNISVAQSIAPVVGSSDTNGTGIDLQGFESATIVVDTGVEGDTLSSSVKVDFILQDSTDNSSFSAVTSNSLVTDGAVDTSTEGGLAGVEEGLAAADAAQGGLDIVTDLASLGVGIGMICASIFGKKHAKSPPPPPTPINASFQAGVN